MKRLSLILSILVALIVAGVVFVLYTVNRTQPNLKFDDRSNTSVEVPLNNGVVELFQNGFFAIDTGASYSTINRSTLETLRNRGVEIEESHFPIIGRGVDGEFHIEPSHCVVTLPIDRYELTTDSLRRIDWLPASGVANTISNVNFVVTDDDVPSTLGMDFLEKFVVGYQYFRQAIVFAEKVDEDYQFMCDIITPYTLNNMLGMGHRYNLSLSVDDKAHEYFINSGLDNLSLKLPESDTIYSKRQLHDDVFRLRDNSMVSAKYVESAWVEIGNRAGGRKIFYSDNGMEQYAINPILFFRQDVVFDFPNRKVYLRPYADLHSDIMPGVNSDELPDV